MSPYGKETIILTPIRYTKPYKLHIQIVLIYAFVITRGYATSLWVWFMGVSLLVIIWHVNEDFTGFADLWQPSEPTRNVSLGRW